MAEINSSRYSSASTPEDIIKQFQSDSLKNVKTYTNTDISKITEVLKAQADGLKNLSNSTIKEREERLKETEKLLSIAEVIYKAINRPDKTNSGGKGSGSKVSEELKTAINEIYKRLLEISHHTARIPALFELEKEFVPRIESHTGDVAATTRVISDVVAKIAERHGIETKDLANLRKSEKSKVDRYADTTARKAEQNDLFRYKINDSIKDLDDLFKQQDKTTKDLSDAEAARADIAAKKEELKKKLEEKEQELEEARNSPPAGAAEKLGRQEALKKEVEDLKNNIEDLNEQEDDFANTILGLQNQVEAERKQIEALKKQEAESLKSRERATEITKSLVNVAKEVINTIWNWYKESFYKIQETYRSYFSEITTKMNLTAREYTKIYQETAAQLRDTHLDVQFDTTDFMAKLQDNLNQGFRGDVARTKTMNDLIVKKLIPSIETNTRMPKQYYKTFGEKYSQIIVGMNKLNESLGKNAEYLESTLYASNEESFGQLLMGMGFDETQIANFHQAAAAFTDAYGEEAARELFSTINQALLSGEVSIPLAQAGYTLPDNILRGLQTDPYKLLSDYVEYNRRMLGQFSGSNQLLLTNVLGGAEFLGTSAASASYINQYYKEGALDIEPTSEEAYLAMWQQEVDKLANGLYSSETEKMSKRFNNKGVVVDSATFLAEHLPEQMQKLLHSVQTGFAAVIAAIAGSNLTGLATNWLSGAMGGVGGTTLSTMGASLGTSGAAAGGTGAAAGGGGIAAGAGIVGGSAAGIATILAAIAGTIWKFYDAFEDSTFGEDSLMKEKIARGDDYLDIVNKSSQATFNRLLNIDNYYLHNDYKYKKSHYKFDTDELWSDVGQGALVAGGILGSFFGPIGALAGAGAGAVVAGGTNAVSQLAMKSGPLEKFYETMDKLDTVVQNTTASLIEYQSSVDETTSLETIANKLYAEDAAHMRTNLDLTNLTNKDLKYLTEAYPEYFGNLTDVSQLSHGYSEVLEMLIETQKEEAKQKLQEQQIKNLDALKEASNSPPFILEGISQDFSSDIQGLKNHAHYDFFKGGMVIDDNAYQAVADKWFEGDTELLTQALGSDKVIERGGAHMLAADITGFGIDKVGNFDMDAFAQNESNLATSKAALLNTLVTANRLASSTTKEGYEYSAAVIQERIDALKSHPGFSDNLHDKNNALGVQIKQFNDNWKAKDPSATLIQYLGGASYIFDDRVAKLHRGEAVVTASEYRKIIEDTRNNRAALNDIKVELATDKFGGAVDASLKTKESVDIVAGILKSIYIWLVNMNTGVSVANRYGNNSPYSDADTSFIGVNYL